MIDLNRIFKKEVLTQKAYGVDSGYYNIKLDANENPYSFPSELRNELSRVLNDVSLNRYPEAGSNTLKERYARYWGVDKDAILVGNGSDELIFLLMTALDASRTGGVLIPVPTFAMYRIGALNAGHCPLEVPLDSKFDLDVKAILETIEREKPGLVFFSYPNNPTGNCFNEGIMEEVIERTPGLVVVDEAYFNFSRKTFLPLLAKYDNLVILRTLSKVGFAALRVGFIMASPLMIRELNKVRLPYNLNSLSQAAAHLFVEHEAVFKAQIDRVIESRRKMFDAMSSMEGIKVYPTEANFILFSCNKEGNSIYDLLRKRGILVKLFHSPAAVAGCIRVSVGTDAENESFLAALGDALACSNPE